MMIKICCCTRPRCQYCKVRAGAHRQYGNIRQPPNMEIDPVLEIKYDYYKLPTSVRRSRCVLLDTFLSILQMVDMRPHRWTDWAIIGPLCTFTREARSMTTWQRSPFWNPVTALPCSLRSPSLLCFSVWNKQSSPLPWHGRPPTHLLYCQKSNSEAKEAVSILLAS